jgi:hypothetical protein
VEQHLTDPTNTPSGARHPLPIRFVMPRPTTVAGVLLAAARIVQAQGLWQGDYVPDPLDREMTVPHSARPMSLVAAIKCAVSGDPHHNSQLADMAIGYLALSLDGGPEFGDIFSLEAHVEAWGDEPGRTGDDVVRMLELAATAPERAA